MKNPIILLISAILFSLTFASCNGDDGYDNSDTSISVTDVTLTHTSATLVVGDTLFLSATVQPDDATDPTISWSVSSAAVTVVDGMVIAGTIPGGVARVTVTTQDGEKTASCGIAVVGGQRGCNSETPGWGESLGIISWGTAGNTDIENDAVVITCAVGGPTQVWSGAVTATNCQKTTFLGGSTSNSNADCRSNPDFPGDLFTWCAVVRFADQLCPYPWRVPTARDFIDLDIAMGGTGAARTGINFINFNYIERWGGTFASLCHLEGTLDGQQGAWAYYWAQTEGTAGNGRTLSFSTCGHILPQSSRGIVLGISLRCVRND